MTEITIEVVRSQADALGLKYHHKAGIATIQGLIAAHLMEHPEDAVKIYGPPQATEVIPEVAKPVEETDEEHRRRDPYLEDISPEANLDAQPLTQVEFQELQKKEARRTVGALVRCRIQNMNPSKKEWPGEIISVGSAKLGTYKKFIPFNGKPYHIPRIILNAMKERKCSVFVTEKDERGSDVRKAQQVNEYAIEELPPLSQAELDALAKRQVLHEVGL